MQLKRRGISQTCGNCKHQGNYTEMVAGRFMIRCEAVEGMVYQHYDGECFLFEEAKRG